MNKKRREIIENNEVSEIKTYKLGGYDQKVLIDGKSRKNPVIIFLHGGPGSSIPFCEGCRGMFPEYTDKAVMVYWDQLGCGINNHIIDDSFSVMNFVDMAIDLIKNIKSEFPDNKLVLFGASWGSFLAAEAAGKVPDLIDEVIVYGQILKNLFFNDDVYTELENAKLSGSQRKQFETIKSKNVHTGDDVAQVAKFIRKYTEGYQSKTGEKAHLGKIIKGILQSPDYTFKDFTAIVKNGYLKNNSIWKELITVDLSNCLKNMSVPYYIIQGSKDIVTSTKTIADFISKAGNKNLSIKIIENNAHIPSADGMEAVYNHLFEKV